MGGTGSMACGCGDLSFGKMESCGDCGAVFHEECALKEAKEAKAVSEAAEAEAAASEAPATTPLIKKRKTKKAVVFLCVRCTRRATRGGPPGGGNAMGGSIRTTGQDASLGGGGS